MVLDKQAYIVKVQNLLADENTYILTTWYPITKHKNKHILILKTIKAQGGLGVTTYKRPYPTGAVPEKYSPKFTNTTLRFSTIVSSQSVVTF